MVPPMKLATILTLGVSRRGKRMMGAPVVSAGTRNLILWYGHAGTSNASLPVKLNAATPDCNRSEPVKESVRRIASHNTRKAQFRKPKFCPFCALLEIPVDTRFMFIIRIQAR